MRKTVKIDVDVDPLVDFCHKCNKQTRWDVKSTGNKESLVCSLCLDVFPCRGKCYHADCRSLKGIEPVIEFPAVTIASSADRCEGSYKSVPFTGQEKSPCPKCGVEFKVYSFNGKTATIPRHKGA